MKLIVKRLLESILEILVWIDSGIGLFVSIPFYLVLGHPHPDSRILISSIVGQYAIAGQKWAIVLEWIIDRIFYIFEGFRLGHCRRFCQDNYDDFDQSDSYIIHIIREWLKND